MSDEEGDRKRNQKHRSLTASLGSSEKIEDPLSLINRVNHESSSSESNPDNQRQPFYIRALHRLEHFEAANLAFNPLDPGIWDEWGVYYCSSRFGRYTRFKPYSLALSLILVIGQNNFFDLIALMHEFGGACFIVVLLITYGAFGYPMYMMEHLLGQYSGHKPVLMARLLMPALSGLGVALYIRTLLRAIGSVGHFAISLYICWDSLFCKGAQSIFLKKYGVEEANYKQFHIFRGLTYPYFTESPEDLALDRWIILACSFAFFMCLKKLREMGGGVMIVFRIMFLILIGYTFSIYAHITPVLLDGQTIKLKENSIIYLPFQTLKPDWKKFFDGNAWVYAISFVFHTLELGTLAHAYLGSKQYYHYRCDRDGFYLIVVAILWNICGAVGVLLWLGYVGISRKEIDAVMNEIEGHHGMFVAFTMKFLQTEMTQQVETDLLFYVALFMTIQATIALLSSVVYLYILIDSSYSESGHPLFKLLIMIFYLITFTFILFPLMISENGIRHMILLEFYGSRPWVVLFLLICLSSAVAWSYGVARLLYDFFNIIHLKGYEVRTHHYQAPKIFAFIYVGMLIFAMITCLAEKNVSTEGPTDWSDPTTNFVGSVMMLSPVIAVIIGAVHYCLTEWKKGTQFLRPHRDFFKNKHHIDVCFKDYQYFTPKQKTRKRNKKNK